MKISLVALASLAVGSFGCTTSTEPAETARAAPATCNVELAFDTGRREDSRVALGAKPCTEKAQRIAMNDGGGVDKTLMVALHVEPAIGGTLAAVSYDVTAGMLPFSPGVLAGPIDPTTPPPLFREPTATRTVAVGAWTEIASGTWPDKDHYRVRVRVVRV